jgi:hypothetical protein
MLNLQTHRVMRKGIRTEEVLPLELYREAISTYLLTSGQTDPMYPIVVGFELCVLPLSITLLLEQVLVPSGCHVEVVLQAGDFVVGACGEWHVFVRPMDELSGRPSARER